MHTAAMSQDRIVVVDDDTSIRDALAEYLGDHGYAVRTASGAAECDRLLLDAPADLLVIDVMMPGEDGLSLCRRLAPGGTPILMLSALDGVTDRVVGLEVGAWDYLAKPFEPRELLARVRALLRRPRVEMSAVKCDAVVFAGWWFSSEERRLRDPQGRPLMLSEGEHALLAAFVRRPGRVLSRDTLLDIARGLDAASYDRAIDIAISRLRRKMADGDAAPLIETVRGAGYRFLPAVRPA
ncbi:MAG TPA: response regulator transcription factor [Sphingomonas sp.]|nr:response regulator transcription factor [Sphingomonas sp.]